MVGVDLFTEGLRYLAWIILPVAGIGYAVLVHEWRKS